MRSVIQSHSSDHFMCDVSRGCVRRGSRDEGHGGTGREKCVRVLRTVKWASDLAEIVFLFFSSRLSLLWFNLMSYWSLKRSQWIHRRIHTHSLSKRQMSERGGRGRGIERRAGGEERKGREEQRICSLYLSTNCIPSRREKKGREKKEKEKTNLQD